MKLHFSKTPIGNLRKTGLAEGTSFLVLLFIAMPLKYMAGIPEAVKYTGWVHGLLFILYIIALVKVRLDYKWTLKKLFVSFVASFLPFGTFILDSRLRKEENELQK